MVKLFQKDIIKLCINTFCSIAVGRLYLLFKTNTRCTPEVYKDGPL